MCPQYVLNISCRDDMLLYLNTMRNPWNVIRALKLWISRQLFACEVKPVKVGSELLQLRASGQQGSIDRAPFSRRRHFESNLGQMWMFWEQGLGLNVWTFKFNHSVAPNSTKHTLSFPTQFSWWSFFLPEHFPDDSVVDLNFLAEPAAAFTSPSRQSLRQSDRQSVS